MISGAHGVRGMVRVRSLTVDPEALFSYAPLVDESGARVFELARRGKNKDAFLVSIKGVSDRTQAESLKGTKLFIERSLLPEAEKGAYYYADLIGLTARDEKGQEVGRVEAVHNYGAGDFIEIKPQDGPSFMLPFKEAFVPQVDVEKGILIVSVPDGWLEEDK